MDITFLDTVTTPHKHRVYELLTTLNIPLLKENHAWLVTSSNNKYDIVYLTNTTTETNYSIRFSPELYGCHYTIYELRDSSDIKKIPVHTGFLEILIPQHDNFFSKTLTKLPIKENLNAKEPVFIGVLDPQGVSDSVVLITPTLKQLQIISPIPRKDMDYLALHFIQTLYLPLNAIRISTNRIGYYIDDTILYFKKQKYKIIKHSMGN